MAAETAPLYDDVANGPMGGFALWLRTTDGVRIRIAIWPEGEKGTVLILPGRTESVEKYGRVAADLHDRGYASVSVDWRGQGLADRPARSAMTGHVARFTDYQIDLSAVMTALPSLSLPQPVYLLSHSMGGAIALRALMEGLSVRAAVFTAPMWGIRMTPSLRPVAWALSTAARAARMGFTLAPGTDLTCYVAVAPFEGNVLTTDPETFAWMKNQLQRHPELGLGGPSLNWLHQALLECRRLRTKPSPKVPALTFLGAQEKVVDVAPIFERMRHWPGGELDVVEGAEHEVLMEKPALRTPAIDRMAALFAAHQRLG
ncbi:MAG: alpha/beta hydrolase [Cereibacter sphaeroides]|uniref:Alpha/beta hydrolase n=1 Tax=Cereibacter sphaeroides TaxID=1063 RepID=A0A2W5S1K2_CERSP|nr:MAG: alpha/beta hydrolase [Cereibacter sphaeroides]